MISSEQAGHRLLGLMDCDRTPGPLKGVAEAAAGAAGAIADVVGDEDSDEKDESQ